MLKHYDMLFKAILDRMKYKETFPIASLSFSFIFETFFIRGRRINQISS